MSLNTECTQRIENTPPKFIKAQVKQIIYHPKNEDLIKQKREFHDLFWTRQKLDSCELRVPLNKELPQKKKILLRNIRTQRIQFKPNNQMSKSLPHGFTFNPPQVNQSVMPSPNVEISNINQKKNHNQSLTFTQMMQKQKKNINSCNKSTKTNSFSNSPTTRRTVSYHQHIGLVRRRSCSCQECGKMSNFQKKQQVYPSVIKYRDHTHTVIHFRSLENDTRTPSQKINTPSQKGPTPFKSPTPINSVHERDENQLEKRKSQHFVTVDIVSTTEEDQCVNLQMLMKGVNNSLGSIQLQKIKRKINISQVMSSLSVKGFQMEKSKSLIRSENFSKQLLINKTHENNGYLLSDSKNRLNQESLKNASDDKKSQFTQLQTSKLYRLDPIGPVKRNLSQIELGGINNSTYSQGLSLQKRRSNISMDSFDNAHFLPYHLKTKQSSPIKTDKNSRKSSFIQQTKQLLINPYSLKKKSSKFSFT